MPHNGIRPPPATAIDDNDAELIAWFLDLLERTPDVYVRAPANGAPPIASTTSLRDGLGIDSIGRLCAYYAVADALGLAADDDGDDESVVSQWMTIGDVLAFVRARGRHARQ